MGEVLFVRARSRTRQAGTSKRRIASAGANLRVQYCPATPERWGDLEQLFGPRGACGGCWCMWLRLTRAQFDQWKGEGNRRALQALVAAGRVPGLLAYSDGRPIGWCSVAPREEFSRLETSRTLRRIDDRPVWSVVCFYVAKPWRRRGITVGLLKAAAAYAREQGATVIEGYPVIPRVPDMPAVFAWPGLAAVFRQAGFIEVARRSATRPIMRLPLRTPRRARSRLSLSR
jgi:GNAT superfamily N-acetyltransferase